MKRYFRGIMLCFSALIIQTPQACAFDWQKAPLACLPDRAVKWKETYENPEPCHCPPQSYCSTVSATTEDILFVTSLYAKNGDYIDTVNLESSEIPDIASGKVSIQDILKMPNLPWDPSKPDDLRTLIAPTIVKKAGYDILHDEVFFKNDITIKLKNPEKMKNWINSITMPLSLASRCCEFICPEGLSPVMATKGIIVPKEHVTFDNNEIYNANAKFRDIYQFVGLATYEISRGTCCSKVTLTDPSKPVSSKYNNKTIYKILSEAGAIIETNLDALKINKKDQNAIDTLHAQMTTFLEAYSTVVPEIKAKLVNEEKITGNFFTKVENEYYIKHTPPEIEDAEIVQCQVEKTFYREGCILRGTPITLADGTEKPIEELNIGDEVLGNQGKAKIKAKSLFRQEVDYMYAINGGKAFFTVEHPILTPKGWKSINPAITSVKKGNTVIVGALEVGDTVLMKGGKTLLVKSIEKVEIKEQPAAYNLSVEGDGSFIANGFIVKGFKQMQMHY